MMAADASAFDITTAMAGFLGDALPHIRSLLPEEGCPRASDAVACTIDLQV